MLSTASGREAQTRETQAAGSSSSLSLRLRGSNKDEPQTEQRKMNLGQILAQMKEAHREFERNNKYLCGKLREQTKQQRRDGHRDSSKLGSMFKKPVWDPKLAKSDQ